MVHDSFKQLPRASRIILEMIILCPITVILTGIAYGIPVILWFPSLGHSAELLKRVSRYMESPIQDVWFYKYSKAIQWFDQY